MFYHSVWVTLLLLDHSVWVAILLFFTLLNTHITNQYSRYRPRMLSLVMFKDRMIIMQQYVYQMTVFGVGKVYPLRF